MLNRLKIICTLICILMIQTSSAVYFSGEVLKKDDLTVIILGDVHADTSKDYSMTAQQKKDILTFSKINNAYIIVEDCIRYEGNDPDTIKKIEKLIKEIEMGPEVMNAVSMAGLCDLCSAENIKSCSCEFRHANSIDDIVKQNEQMFNELKAFKNPAAQKHLDELWKKHNLLLARNEYLKFNTDQLFEFNAVYKLWNALQKNKNTLFIIAVGASHVRPISELIRDIFKFNTVLRKNYFRMPDFLGSPEKNKELFKKMEKITIEHALYLPQFFQEALKAQPIRSRL